MNGDIADGLGCLFACLGISILIIAVALATVIESGGL